MQETLLPFKPRMMYWNYWKWVSNLVYKLKVAHDQNFVVEKLREPHAHAGFTLPFESIRNEQGNQV